MELEQRILEILDECKEGFTAEEMHLMIIDADDRDVATALDKLETGGQIKQSADPLQSSTRYILAGR